VFNKVKFLKFKKEFSFQNEAFCVCLHAVGSDPSEKSCVVYKFITYVQVLEGLLHPLEGFIAHKIVLSTLHVSVYIYTVHMYNNVNIYSKKLFLNCIRNRISSEA
jgi:hypothetical protein